MDGVGLSASTTFPCAHTSTVGAFEAAVACAAVEAAVIKGADFSTPLGGLVGGVLPITNFLIHGTEGHRQQTLNRLEFASTHEALDSFHAGFVCIESIAKNLSDVLHQRYHRGAEDYDDNMVALVNAALLAVRSKMLWIPHTVFGATDEALVSHLSDASSSLRQRGTRSSSHRECLLYLQTLRFAERTPIIAPGIAYLKQHLDLVDRVNSKVYIDIKRGEVVAETVQRIAEGAELFQPYNPPFPNGAVNWFSDDNTACTTGNHASHRRPSRAPTSTTLPLVPKIRAGAVLRRSTTSAAPYRLPRDEEDVSVMEGGASLLSLVGRYGSLNIH